MNQAKAFYAVVVGLFALAGMALVGTVVLLALDKQVPDVLGYVLTSTVTGAVGMLAKSPRDDTDEPAPVTVANTPANPVAVADVHDDPPQRPLRARKEP